MNKKSNWQAILGISAVGICLVCCLSVGLTIRFAPNIYQYFVTSTSLKVGDAAPDFVLQTLDGTAMRLTDFKGKPILLSFGATWCPDCRVEAPLLEDLHKANPELIVLLVDIKEDREAVQQFAEQFELTHPILLDRDGSVSTLYQVFAIPTELFVDAKGIIRAKIIEKVTPELLAENLSLIGIDP